MCDECEEGTRTHAHKCSTDLEQHGIGEHEGMGDEGIEPEREQERAGKACDDRPHEDGKALGAEASLCVT